jgi:hypothetical protein
MELKVIDPHKKSLPADIVTSRKAFFNKYTTTMDGIQMCSQNRLLLIHNFTLTIRLSMLLKS